MATFDVVLKDRSTGSTRKHVAAGADEAAVARSVDSSRFEVLTVSPREVTPPAPPPPQTTDDTVRLLEAIEASLKLSRRSLSLSVAFGVFVALVGFSIIGGVLLYALRVFIPV